MSEKHDIPILLPVGTYARLYNESVAAHKSMEQYCITQLLSNLTNTDVLRGLSAHFKRPYSQGETLWLGSPDSPSYLPRLGNLKVSKRLHLRLTEEQRSTLAPLVLSLDCPEAHAYVLLLHEGLRVHT